MTDKNSQIADIYAPLINFRILRYLFTTIIIFIFVSSNNLYGQVMIDRASRDELKKLIPKDILDKCNSDRLNDMQFQRDYPPPDGIIEPDTSLWSLIFLPQVMEARYLQIHGKSYILAIAGCYGCMAILLADSSSDPQVIFRLRPNIPFHSGYFNDYKKPLMDINGDSIPDIEVNFSYGGIGSEVRFLSILPDSLYFLSNDDGYGFGLDRGQLKLIDIDDDGIMEIYIDNCDIYGKRIDCQLYKWDGVKYVLISTDCLEKK